MAQVDGVATIQIHAELHPKLKDRAEQARMPLKDYTTKIIHECIARLEFLEREAPLMQLLPQQPVDKRLIADAKEKTIVTVGIHDGKIYCENCQTDCCKHTNFVKIYPDMKALAEKMSEL